MQIIGKYKFLMVEGMALQDLVWWHKVVDLIAPQVNTPSVLFYFSTNKLPNGRW